MKKFLPKSVKNPQGFTLVELLVVISIIAILSVIGITVFGGVQKSARDAKRRGDVDAISKAYESNYTSGSATPYGIPNPATWFSSGVVPKDPRTNADYWWNGAQTVPTAARVTYTICALLENFNGNSLSAGDGTNFTSASGATATYHCAKNQQ